MWMLPVQNQSWVSEFILLGFSNDPTSNRILFIAFLLLYLSSVLGNGLIITLISLDSHLHTPMYFFLSILSLLDMGYVTTTIPQMLVHLISSSKTISFAGCWLQMYVFGALGLTESILFVIMAYDRYVAICHPLRYTVILTWELCMWLATLAWTCGFFLSLIHTFSTMGLPYCGPNIINHYFCEGPSVWSLACMDTHIIEMVDLVISVFVVVAPLSLILASYIHIALAISKIKSTQGRCKTLSTCASHLTVVTFFYVPAIYIYMRPNSSYSPDHDKQISFVYNILTALLNPMAYSLRNKDFKVAILKVMGSGRMAWTMGC
ncbi:olfactory receptor 2A12-like [Dasypus novemcinctus]|uniref:olfactory receptor 2A12-like n=1 Tax=Dasypus novemcinctus TaxID=9361 RepID=UPI00265DCB96|nr:olfactory receptor 2A12-like [Dasypus novemcinctus]